jgi:hypothetical protein
MLLSLPVYIGNNGITLSQVGDKYPANNKKREG